jgi:hypothetical protein
MDGPYLGPVAAANLAEPLRRRGGHACKSSIERISCGNWIAPINPDSRGLKSADHGEGADLGCRQYLSVVKLENLGWSATPFLVDPRGLLT